ncbi:hypothetical protein FGO68_gene11705 [Halteria grandinella]|uniref:Uncharacterized protein n=1 Tax=Halteria grandinella TaxID=5974 RepID=A0A8J8NP70_HALGN|nr:hypothetical protein FGO68_gene11705 [Halteria grandinella]
MVLALKQALNKFCWLNQQHEVAKSSLEGKCYPEHAIKSTHGIFGATEGVFAKPSLGVQANWQPQLVDERLLWLLHLLLLVSTFILVIMDCVYGDFLSILNLMRDVWGRLLIHASCARESSALNYDQYYNLRRIASSLLQNISPYIII